MLALRGDNMQTNPNIEDKRIVEVCDWKDSQWQYSPWQKKYYRRLRRKIMKRELEKYGKSNSEKGFDYTQRY